MASRCASRLPTGRAVAATLAAAGLGALVAFTLLSVPATASPVATASPLAIQEGGRVPITPMDLSATDGAAPSDQVGFVVVQAPAQGTLRRAGQALDAGAAFTQADVEAGRLGYEHAGGEAATDRIGLRPTGPSGSGGRVDLDVTVVPVNDPPRLGDLAVVAREDQAADVPLGLVDPDGPTPEVRVVERPASGSARVVGNSLRYSPVPDFHGEDRFTVEATDGAGGKATAVVRAVVLPVNDIPFANADIYRVRPGRVLVVAPEHGLLANDYDVDGDVLTAILSFPPGNGKLELRPDGGLTYTPDPGFTGRDRFTYRVADTDVQPQHSTVDIEVQDNTAPLAGFRVSRSVVAIGTNVVLTDTTFDDGNLTAWEWAFGDGGVGTGPAPNHTYTAPGLHAVRLTVTDDEGLSASAERRVEVRGNGTSDAMPLANAGPDRLVAVGTQVLLEGSSGFVDQYWVQVGGPPVPLDGAETRKARFVAPGQPTRLAFDLVVFDGVRASLPDRVEVIVAPEGELPEVRAGSDVVVRPGSEVRLSASVAGFDDESMPTFTWEQLDGPAVDATPEGSVLRFRAPDHDATLVFGVRADDGLVGTLADEVTVKVEAGAPRGFHHVRAQGSPEFAFEAEVAGTSYRWDFGDGQAAQGANVRHAYRDPGRHNVTLEVTHSDGSTASYTQSVLVPRSTGRRSGDAEIPAPGVPVVPALALSAALAAAARRKGL